MKYMVKRVFGAVLLAMFLLLILALIASIVSGEKSSFSELIMMIKNFGISIQYPLAIISTLISIAVQLLILWAFYYFGMKLWKTQKK